MQDLRPPPHMIAVLGATGDLARRKLLPALFHLHQEGLLPERYAVVGSSRDEFSDEEFRSFAREAADSFCRCAVDDRSWASFASRLRFVPGEFEIGSTGAMVDAIERGEEELGPGVRRLFYLAVPPTAFEPITAGLEEAKLVDTARVIYEKPFGMNAESFKRLDAVVADALRIEQVYRIDHFLGKETVQNILALRFGNGMFASNWNAEHIDHVQIDVPEDLGIGTRAGFYEQTGALRDMVVTHLFQVLSIVAMEPPAALRSDALIDAKVDVFEAMRPLSKSEVVYGQYDGYLEAEGVSPQSTTETFVAAVAHIDNERWRGVPFLLRTGKRMAESRQTVTLAFRPPDHRLFPSGKVHGMRQDHLTLDLGSDRQSLQTFWPRSRVPRCGSDLRR